MKEESKKEKAEKIEKTVIDIVRTINKDNNYIIYDTNEFSKKVKHLIEGICKIDNLEKRLLYKTETSFSLKLSIWDNETYKIFKGKIKELVNKYTFQIFEYSIPSRKTEITQKVLYPLDRRCMLLVRELRLLLFEIAVRLHPDIPKKDYYISLYKICSEYEYEYRYRYMHTKCRKKETETETLEAHESIKEYYSIRRTYYNEFLKLSLKSNESCFPYELDPNDEELYDECSIEYNLNPNQDLDNLIKVCRQKLMNRKAAPEDIERELNVHPPCIEFDFTNMKRKKRPRRNRGAVGK